MCNLFFLHAQRSVRQTAETRIESLQAQLDRQRLMTEQDISHEDLRRIATRHIQVCA